MISVVFRKLSRRGRLQSSERHHGKHEHWRSFRITQVITSYFSSTCPSLYPSMLLWVTGASNLTQHALGSNLESPVHLICSCLDSETKPKQRCMNSILKTLFRWNDRHVTLSVFELCFVKHIGLYKIQDNTTARHELLTDRRLLFTSVSN